MSERIKYLLKNTGILTISSFATKILSIFLVPLYTGILTTTEYGIFDLVGTSTSIIFPILTLNIVEAVMRFAMDRKCSNDHLCRIGMRYVLRSDVIVLAVLSIIYAFKLVPAIQEYLIFFFLCYFFSSMNTFLSQFARGCERVKEIGIAGVISTLCTIGFNLLFLLGFRLGLTGFFLASVFSELIVCIYYTVSTDLAGHLRRGKTDREMEKEMLRYCIPLIATTIGWWINNASDKYIVAFFCGVSANGILSVSYKIPNIMNILQNIFIQAWQISAIREYEREESAVFYGKVFSAVNVIMCAACSWLIFLAVPIAGLLFAKDFFAAWQYVPFLTISSMINCASGMLGPILAAKKATKPLAMSAVYGAGANVILNILLVWLIGIQGAAIATAISSLIIYQVRKNAVGQEIQIARYSRVLMTWGGLCIQALISIYTTWRWLELLIMAGLLILNFSEIRTLLKTGIGMKKEPGINQQEDETK